MPVIRGLLLLWFWEGILRRLVTTLCGARGWDYHLHFYSPGRAPGIGGSVPAAKRWISGWVGKQACTPWGCKLSILECGWQWVAVPGEEGEGLIWGKSQTYDCGAVSWLGYLLALVFLWIYLTAGSWPPFPILEGVASDLGPLAVLLMWWWWHRDGFGIKRGSCYLGGCEWALSREQG